MASYHLSVKSVSRSGGRSATAAAAYRAAEKIDCRREGRTHDYTRKSGVEHVEIVAPVSAPEWVRDRAALWNGAEAAENRKNSVVAREWELALPSELDEAARRELAMDFAHELVARYGVVADVCIHAPHREGDQRNHHAHVMTTTREIGEEGFGAKTRILDVKQTASLEVSAMRALWAERQNAALEQVGTVERVDHRTLEAQRETAEAERDRLEAALEQRHRAEAEAREQENPGSRRMQAVLDKAGIARKGDGETERDSDWQETERQLAVRALEAVALDRPAEIKLGPKASGMERRAERRAKAEGRPYEPVTDIGAQVHELREQRSLFEAAIERLERAGGNVVRHLRETVSWVRDTVLGERGPARGRNGERAEDVGSGETQTASDRRRALLDRLRTIGRGDADGRGTAEDKTNERLGRFTPDRTAPSATSSPAEEVQKHMRRIEEENQRRAQAEREALQQAHAREALAEHERQQKQRNAERDRLERERREFLEGLEKRDRDRKNERGRGISR